jgi:hypothetical protein
MNAVLGGERDAAVLAANALHWLTTTAEAPAAKFRVA